MTIKQRLKYKMFQVKEMRKCVLQSNVLSLRDYHAFNIYFKVLLLFSQKKKYACKILVIESTQLFSQCIGFPSYYVSMSLNHIYER